MFFPDQSHINQVRDALGKRSSRATVMVGAGFSRNASGIIPDAILYSDEFVHLTGLIFWGDFYVCLGVRMSAFREYFMSWILRGQRTVFVWNKR